jgi:reverse gyrase
VFEDSGDEPFEVRIGDAEVENSGFVVAEIIRRIDDRWIEELKQL